MGLHPAPMGGRERNSKNFSGGDPGLGGGGMSTTTKTAIFEHTNSWLHPQVASVFAVACCRVLEALMGIFFWIVLQRRIAVGVQNVSPSGDHPPCLGAVSTQRKLEKQCWGHYTRITSAWEIPYHFSSSINIETSGPKVHEQHCARYHILEQWHFFRWRILLGRGVSGIFRDLVQTWNFSFLNDWMLEMCPIYSCLKRLFFSFSFGKLLEAHLDAISLIFLLRRSSANWLRQDRTVVCLLHSAFLRSGQKVRICRVRPTPFANKRLEWATRIKWARGPWAHFSHCQCQWAVLLWPAVSLVVIRVGVSPRGVSLTWRAERPMTKYGTRCVMGMLTVSCANRSTVHSLWPIATPVVPCMSRPIQFVSPMGGYDLINTLNSSLSTWHRKQSVILCIRKSRSLGWNTNSFEKCVSRLDLAFCPAGSAWQRLAKTLVGRPELLNGRENFWSLEHCHSRPIRGSHKHQGPSEKNNAIQPCCGVSISLNVIFSLRTDRLKEVCHPNTLTDFSGSVNLFFCNVENRSPCQNVARGVCFFFQIHFVRHNSMDNKNPRPFVSSVSWPPIALSRCGSPEPERNFLL